MRTSQDGEGIVSRMNHYQRRLLKRKQEKKTKNNLKKTKNNLKKTKNNLKKTKNNLKKTKVTLASNDDHEEMLNIIEAKTEYNVVIPDMVFQKIMVWVNMSTFEVSGFGKVVFDSETKTFTVKDAWLVKQKNSSTQTEIDPVDLGRLSFQTREVEGELNWWWHSHVQMPVFWSGTDMTAMQEQAVNGWVLATVFNQRNEKRSAFMGKTEVMGKSHLLFSDELSTKVERLLNPEQADEWKKSYEDKVSNQSYSYAPSNNPMFDLDRDDDHRWSPLATKDFSGRYADGPDLPDDRFNFSNKQFINDRDYEWVQGYQRGGLWHKGYYKWIGKGVDPDFDADTARGENNISKIVEEALMGEAAFMGMTYKDYKEHVGQDYTDNMMSDLAMAYASEDLDAQLELKSGDVNGTLNKTT